MDFSALWLSFTLAAASALLLLPIAIFLGRALAYSQWRIRPMVEALIALPIVLPPTVIGYYFLTLFSPHAALGSLWQRWTGSSLNFSFSGLLLASLIVNLPFAVQPVQRAFASIPHDIQDAALCSGLNFWQRLARIELPLAWPGLVTALAICFAHTLGEFGVVLMVGGNIPGQTRTLSIAIFDAVQRFDLDQAGNMSTLLLVLSAAVLALCYGLIPRRIRQEVQ